MIHYYYEFLPVWTDLKPITSSPTAADGEMLVYGPEASAGPLPEHVAATQYRELVRSAVQHTLLAADWGEGAAWPQLLPTVPPDLLPPVWGLATFWLLDRRPLRGRQLGPISDRRHSLAARIAARLIDLGPSDAYWWIANCRRREIEWLGMPSGYLRWVSDKHSAEVVHTLRVAKIIFSRAD